MSFLLPSSLSGCRDFPAESWLSARPVASRDPVLMVAFLAGFAGLFSTGVLSAGHLLNIPVPCDGSHGAQLMAHPPSSRLFGVPVTVFGATTYLAILFLLARPLLTTPVRRLLVLLTGAGAAASAALNWYALTALQPTCLWSLASASAMTLLFLCTLALARAPLPVMGLRRTWVWILVYLTAAALGWQGGSMRRHAHASAKPPEPPIPHLSQTADRDS